MTETVQGEDFAGLALRPNGHAYIYMLPDRTGVVLRQLRLSDLGPFCQGNFDRRRNFGQQHLHASAGGGLRCPSVQHPYV